MNEVKTIMESVFGLYEGRGVAARSKGDTYINDKGHVLNFEQVIFVPESSDGMQTDELIKTINNWKMSNSEIETKEVNEVKDSACAIITVFKDKKKNSFVAFIKYLKRFNTNRLASWDNANFRMLTGYEYTSNLTKKEKSGIKASDLLSGGNADVKPEVLSADALIEKVKANVANSPKLAEESKADINNLIDNFAMGSANLVPLTNESMASAYEDYLGEILAPYAIVKGIKVTGDIQNSESKLLSPFSLKYSDMQIRFNHSASEKLIDSTLVSPDGNTKIGISSKANSDGGAAAAVTNLYHALSDVDDAWKEKNKYAVDIIQSIVKTRAVYNPLELARIAELIQGDEYKIYKDYISAQSNSSTPIPVPKVPSANAFLNAIKVKESTASSQFYTLLAGMAKMSAGAINKNAKFNITQAFLELLNKSSILQVYTIVKTGKKGMRFDGFNVKYPPQFKGKIEIWTSTRFKSTGISGKVGFKLI
jgi:hypothetical protein